MPFLMEINHKIGRNLFLPFTGQKRPFVVFVDAVRGSEAAHGPKNDRSQENTRICWEVERITAPIDAVAVLSDANRTQICMVAGNVVKP